MISASIISCNNSILLLPRVALPNIFPSIILWSKLSRLRTCHSYLCFLEQIIFNMLLASLARTNTSSFVTFSVQLIFSILHHVHISNAFNSFVLALVNVQVSATYSATLQTVLFIIHSFCSQFCGFMHYTLKLTSRKWLKTKQILLKIITCIQKIRSLNCLPERSSNKYGIIDQT